MNKKVPTEFKEVMQYGEYATYINEEQEAYKREKAEKKPYAEPIKESPYAEQVQTKVTTEYIQAMIDSAEVVVSKVLNKTIVVAVKLVNGFEIIESATCLDIETYDEQRGIDICFQKIGDKLFELEAYRVSCELNEIKTHPRMELNDSIKSNEKYPVQDNGPQSPTMYWDDTKG